MRYISLYFFALLIFIFVFGFCGFMQQVSSKLFTRTSTSFWYWIFGVSFDGEEGEGVVEEELVDEPGTTKWYIVGFFAINSLLISDEMWFFDRWSSGVYTHDPRRVSREKELREFFQEHDRHE